MHHIHITRELLAAEGEDERAAYNLFHRVMAHLFQVCPICRAEARAYGKEALEQAEAHEWYESLRQSGEPISGEAAGRRRYEAVFARVAEATSRMVPKVAAQRRQARRKLAELLALPAARRSAAIAGAPLEYRGPALAVQLLETSLGRMPGKPEEALALAQLAKVVLSHSALASLVTELYARASAHVANALRALGRLPEASVQFEDARFLLRHQPAIDPLTAAELDTMEGTLRRDQRRFDDARVLLERAALTYQRVGTPRDTAIVQLKLGALYFECGSPTEAAHLASRVLSALTFDDEALLCLYARHNLACALCELGQHGEAREVLAESRSLALDRGDALSQLRLQWIEGKIARGLGESQEAETLFLLARHGFEQQGLACDAALVSLDLAALYLEHRRTADVKALAAEMVAIFEGQEIHREAATALHLFRDAAELEQVTLGLVQNLATYLVRASRDPAFAYQAGS